MKDMKSRMRRFNVHELGVSKSEKREKKRRGNI